MGSSLQEVSKAIREADGKGTPVEDRPKKSEGSSGEPEAPPVAEPREKTEQEMEAEPLSFLDEWTADEDYWENYRKVNMAARLGSVKFFIVWVVFDRGTENSFPRKGMSASEVEEKAQRQFPSAIKVSAREVDETEYNEAKGIRASSMSWLDERNKRDGKKRKGSQIREVRSGNYKGVSYFILKDDEDAVYYSDAVPSQHAFDSADEAEQATKDFIDKGKKLSELSTEKVKSTSDYDIYEYIPGEFEIYNKEKQKFETGKYGSLQEAEQAAKKYFDLSAKLSLEHFPFTLEQVKSEAEKQSDYLKGENRKSFRRFCEDLYDDGTYGDLAGRIQKSKSAAEFVSRALATWEEK